jgi:hypothetical protein
LLTWFLYNICVSVVLNGSEVKEVTVRVEKIAQKFMEDNREIEKLKKDCKESTTEQELKSRQVHSSVGRAVLSTAL